MFAGAALAIIGGATLQLRQDYRARSKWRREAPRREAHSGRGTQAGVAPLMRTAVIGVGYLGRFHAQKYSVLSNSQLVGIADPSASARAAVAAELGVPAYADYRELLGRVDAVSIVTPTPSHYAVAKEFLEAGAHVLVEKPMTATVAEGESLIEVARRAKRFCR